ncbi:PsiF family protein [Bradyrhizobium genosp. P]|uniref:PsiF family protein n=1 Tax=Bradyrhizobium genosp. P TaxID=83641 RepID=UPI003CF6041D
MKTISTLATATALAPLLLMGGAFAQTPAAPAATPAPAATTKMSKDTKPHTAASIECSKEADAKGLHGKERKKFRSECKKSGGAAPAAAPAK